MRKIAFTALLIVLSLSMAFANGSKEKDGYVFAADATWPPLEFVAENGDLTGFEVELMPMIGEKVGVKMTVKNIPWDTIFAGLANGQYDGVASGVTITEERKATMDFSTPILSDGQILIIRSSDASLYKSIDDMKGKKIGTQIGTTGDFALEKYDVDIRRYDDIGLAIEDMLNGNIDGAVCNSTIASDFVLANDSYKNRITVAGEPFTTEDIAIAVKKNNKELLNLINKGLDMMMKDGSFDALKAKWNLI